VCVGPSIHPIKKDQHIIIIITYSKGRREASFHPSVRHPSVPSWSVYSDRAEKEWKEVYKEWEKYIKRFWKCSL